MKCVLSLDDYCWQTKESIKYLEELNNYFSDFKISLFTIPCFKQMSLSSHWDELSDVKFKAEHILHGYYHTTAEFENLDKFQSAYFIERGIEEFKKCNLPIIKGFKSPNWRNSNGLFDYLKSVGFWLATLRPVNIDGLRIYNWNWDIGDNNIPTSEIVHAHGHTHNVSGPGAGIEVSMNNIRKLPADTEFLFISEVMK